MRAPATPTYGAGGETHRQPATTSDPHHPAGDPDRGRPEHPPCRRARAGALEDFAFREKVFHFDHERIPERVVHARGFGAHGYFEAYESLADITRADPFQEAGRRTPAFVRFSTVAGSKGSFDLARDVRGFAVKLYTQEGNWDLVGNNIPVFFIQDPIKFPDVIHSVKPEPDRASPRPSRRTTTSGTRVAHARVDPHAHVGHVRPGHPSRSGSWRASASTRSGSSTRRGAPPS